MMTAEQQAAWDELVSPNVPEIKFNSDVYGEAILAADAELRDLRDVTKGWREATIVALIAVACGAGIIGYTVRGLPSHANPPAIHDRR